MDQTASISRSRIAQSVNIDNKSSLKQESSERYILMKLSQKKRANDQTFDQQRREQVKIEKYLKSPAIMMMRKMMSLSEQKIIKAHSSRLDNRFPSRSLRIMAEKSHHTLQRIKSQRQPINASKNLEFNISKDMQTMIRDSLINENLPEDQIVMTERLQHSQAFYEHLKHLRTKRDISPFVYRRQYMSTSQSNAITPIKNSRMATIAMMIQDSRDMNYDIKQSARELERCANEIPEVINQETHASSASERQEPDQVIDMIKSEPRAQYNYKVMKALTVKGKDIRQSRKKLYQFDKFYQVVLPSKKY